LRCSDQDGALTLRLASLIRVSLLAAVPALVASPAIAQKNEGMGVVAPSKPILNLENLQAPSSPGSASAPPPASPPKVAPAPKPPAAKSGSPSSSK
jgi:hypothetical protein